MAQTVFARVLRVDFLGPLLNSKVGVLEMPQHRFPDYCKFLLRRSWENLEEVI